jgi:E3 ubiquitin-protein ligase UBR4
MIVVEVRREFVGSFGDSDFWFSTGGPQSNMHLVPYLMFFALYISLSTRSYTREEKNLTAFLAQPVGEKWLESSYEIDGPVYQAVVSIVLHTPDMWAKNLVTYHVRSLYPSSTCKALNGVGDKDMKDYNVYKPGLMIFALVELIYKNYFAKVVNPKEEDWPVSVFGYIRKNDEAMMKSAVTTLETFREEFLPCTSFGEFCDVAGEMGKMNIRCQFTNISFQIGLFGEIDDPDGFIIELLQSLPGSGGK